MKSPENDPTDGDNGGVDQENPTQEHSEDRLRDINVGVSSLPFSTPSSSRTAANVDLSSGLLNSSGPTNTDDKARECMEERAKKMKLSVQESGDTSGIGNVDLSMGLLSPNMRIGDNISSLPGPIVSSVRDGRSIPQPRGVRIHPGGSGVGPGISSGNIHPGVRAVQVSLRGQQLESSSNMMRMSGNSQGASHRGDLGSSLQLHFFQAPANDPSYASELARQLAPQLASQLASLLDTIIRTLQLQHQDNAVALRREGRPPFLQQLQLHLQLQLQLQVQMTGNSQGVGHLHYLFVPLFQVPVTNAPSYASQHDATMHQNQQQLSTYNSFIPPSQGFAVNPFNAPQQHQQQLSTYNFSIPLFQGLAANPFNVPQQQQGYLATLIERLIDNATANFDRQRQQPFQRLAVSNSSMPQSQLTISSHVQTSSQAQRAVNNARRRVTMRQDPRQRLYPATQQASSSQHYQYQHILRTSSSMQNSPQSASPLYLSSLIREFIEEAIRQRPQLTSPLNLSNFIMGLVQEALREYFQEQEHQPPTSNSTNFRNN